MKKEGLNKFKELSECWGKWRKGLCCDNPYKQSCTEGNIITVFIIYNIFMIFLLRLFFCI